MDWTIWVVAVGVLVVWWVLKRRGLVPAEEARRHLREGAALLDVRSPAEFRQGHLAGAVNIPLGELSEAVVRQFPDRDRVLLLHCLSGGRSGIAQIQLRRLGYRRAYNLGSYRRAEGVVRTAAV